MSSLLMPVAGPAAHKLSTDTLGLAQRGEADAGTGAFAQALRRSSDAMKAPAAPAATGAQASPGGPQRRESTSDPAGADASPGTGPGAGTSANGDANAGTNAGEVSGNDDAGDGPRTRGRAGARRAGGDGRRATPDRIDGRGAQRAEDRSALPGSDETTADLAGDAGAGTETDPATQEALGGLAGAGLPMNPADPAGRQADGLPGGQTPTGAGAPMGVAGGLPQAADATGTGGGTALAPEATTGLPATDAVARTPAGAAGPDTGATGQLTDARPDRTPQGLTTAQRWRSAEPGATAGALPGKAGTTPMTPGAASTGGLRNTGTAPGARTASLQWPGTGTAAADPVGTRLPTERTTTDPVTVGTPAGAAAPSDPSQAALPSGELPAALATAAGNGPRETSGDPAGQGTPAGPAGVLAMPASAGAALPSTPTASTDRGGRAAATGLERATLQAAAPAAAALLRGAGDSARAEGPGQRASGLRRNDTEAGPGQRSGRATEGTATDALARDPAGLATAGKAQGLDTGARGEGAGTGQTGTGATNNASAGAANGSPGTGPRGAESFQALLAAAGPAAPAVGPPVAPHTAAQLPSVWLAMPMHSPEFSPALGAQITMLARDGVQEARIELNPAEMGPITVRIAIQSGGAQVDFQAEQAATRQVIEASLPNLAGALRDAGLTLTGGGVFEPPPPAPADAGFSAASGQGQAAQSGGGGADNGRSGTRQGLAGRPSGDADPLDRGSTTVLQPGTIRGLVDLVA